MVVESIILAGIIFGAVYVEHWNSRRLQRKEEAVVRRKIFDAVNNDLNRKIRFIEDSIQYGDYKPFFTDIWDAVVLSGKQTLLSFEMFENLQHTFSWMKYYNTELQQKSTPENVGTLKDVLSEVRKSIDQSLMLLKNANI